MEAIERIEGILEVKDGRDELDGIVLRKANRSCPLGTPRKSGHEAVHILNRGVPALTCTVPTLILPWSSYKPVFNSHALVHL